MQSNGFDKMYENIFLVKGKTLKDKKGKRTEINLRQVLKAIRNTRINFTVAFD